VGQQKAGMTMRWQTSTAWVTRTAIAAIAATTIVSGQSQTGSTQKPPAQQKPATPQNPGQETVFRTTTNFVSTNVLARDDKGQFVPDLRQDEFQVYEDGVLQKVSYFNTFVGGRALGAPTVSIAAPTSEGLILPRQVPPPDASGRIFIIFIDDLHLLPNQTPKTRAILEQIRDTLVKDNDLVGFVSSGYSSIATDIQYDYQHKRFNEAIKKTMGGGQTADEIIKAPAGQDGPSGIRYLANVAFSTAHEIVQNAEKITNRRKSFIYVSSGYDFDPYKDSRLKYQQDLYGMPDKDPNGGPITTSTDAHNYNDPFAGYSQNFSDADLIAELAELIRSANRANVTFYTIDPRGLTGMMDIDENLTYEEWHDHFLTTITSLQVLGEQTGGFCVCNNNNYKQALQRIDAETSDYYMIGYSSSNPDPLKYVRKIEIRITRPGVHAENYRTEYTLPRPSKTKK
jgi:VWFA-related protein